MAVEGDKLQSLISKMVEIETAEQPAEKVVVEMTPEEKAREFCFEINKRVGSHHRN